MKPGVEYLKRLNMAELLSCHYQMQFSHNGNVYASLSPFCEESEPSFFIKQESDGHWLFKDFSSGHGGSIIDFVMLKENLNRVSAAVKHFQCLLNQNRDSKIYICESIIDYLSIKTLAGISSQGIALLGNQLNGYDLEFLNNTPTLVSCFDNDGGGFSGYLDLTGKYSEKQIEIYELQANQKDINDRLVSEKQSAAAQNLTAKDKLAIYQAFVGSDNRSQLASDWGIDRSYLYKIVKECEATIVNNFNDKRPGRKSAYDVANRADARSLIEQLETEKQKLARDKEYYHAQSEFLKIRLKFSDQEIAELRGDKEASKKTPIKKKKKKKR